MDDLPDILFIYLIVVLIWLVVAGFTLISIIKRRDMATFLRLKIKRRL